MPREREVWPDAVKIIACIFVVLGHFTQSMVKSGFMVDSALYGWFQETIYSFHVPLFFVCSGYLYQRYSKVDSFSSWWLNVKKKSLALGIPYLFFTCATLVLKELAGDFANSREASPIETLLFEPTAPYWFLYTLFFLFLIIPTARSRRMCFAILVVTSLAKVLSLSGLLLSSLPYAIMSAMENGIWFALGMGLAELGWLGLCDWKTAVAGFMFLPLSGALYASDAGSTWWFVAGLCACLFFISACRTKLAGRITPLVEFLARWTMPVYLMHTIFAAGWRVALLKLGITSVQVHFVTGVAVGFMGPVVAALVLDWLKPLDFLIYPTRYINLKPKGSK